jgi:hypothetical protein
MVEFPKQSQADTMHATFNDLVDVRHRIIYYLKRNRDGIAKCRDAIYQLMLIKKYAPENPFKVLNRDVMLIIAKMLYVTIGTKVWCQSAKSRP